MPFRLPLPVPWMPLMRKLRNVTTAVAGAETTMPLVPETSTPAKLVLNIEVTARSWVKLEADGETVVNDDLSRGYHRSVEAKDGFTFRTIGNAAGITLTLNDVPVPALGRNGQVLHDVVLDRAFLQKMQSPPQNPQ